VRDNEGKVRRQVKEERGYGGQVSVKTGKELDRWEQLKEVDR
jgi:hypothetical protein